MSTLGKAFRAVASVHAVHRARSVARRRVLVVGVFLRDRDNLAPEIVASTRSRRHEVVQCWASIGTGQQRAAEMRAHTALHFAQPLPKFAAVNRLLALHDLSAFDNVVVTDDDIELPAGFMDDFIGLQAHYRFALAQPARSQQSNIDHPVTLERHARIARQTRFVEIGPLFSVAAPAFQLLLPFDESFHMGWGLDHVWPAMLQQGGLTQGIIDLTPVHHRMRPVAATYSGAAARQKMAELLAGRATISQDDRSTHVRTLWW